MQIPALIQRQYYQGSNASKGDAIQDSVSCIAISEIRMLNIELNVLGNIMYIFRNHYKILPLSYDVICFAKSQKSKNAQFEKGHLTGIDFVLAVTHKA